MKDEKGFESLNMIPFIDIMLVLLTIVLTTSSFIASGRIPVNLPTASKQTPAERETEIVEIDAQGGYYYRGTAVTRDELAGKFAGIPRDTPILLRADRKTPLQEFVTVADLLKGMQFQKLALQTETRAP
jgi:biopolymer transport protein ExbD